MDHRHHCRFSHETLLLPVVMIISVFIIFSRFDLLDSRGLQFSPDFREISDVRNTNVEVKRMFSGTEFAGLEAQLASDDPFLREDDYKREESFIRNMSFSSSGSKSSCDFDDCEEVPPLELFPRSQPDSTDDSSDESTNYVHSCLSSSKKIIFSFTGDCRDTTPVTDSVGIVSTPVGLASVQNSTADVPLSSAKPATNNNVSYVELDSAKRPTKGENRVFLKNNLTTDIPAEVSHVSRLRDLADMSIPDMNKWLLHSLPFTLRVKPRWFSSVDKELQQVKVKIQNAYSHNSDPSLYDPLYRNLTMFQRSYELMERMLKIYVYKEGEKPILHQPVLQGIYASEGWFMKLLVSSNKFVTRNPHEAHLFYLPFSSRNLEEKLYVPGSHSLENIVQYLKHYLDIIVAKHNFWNRTEGADHFFVACHDWAPRETSYHMSNCIRALCNADTKEGFSVGKDVSLPETLVRAPKHLQRGLGGKPALQRSILAFFAGNMHGYLRPILLQHWGGKDPDMRIYGRMPKTPRSMNYAQHMKSSKYCICARGYEVNSPRVVEAIFYECVPVIISDNFVPPFFSILNWESFAVFVLEKDIPNLKNILLAISEERYLQLHMGVKRVQHHFIWHSKPVKYDLFHMILHSIWFSRVFRT